MTTSAAPIVIPAAKGEWVISGPMAPSISLLVAAYASALTALISTFVRFRNERSGLARWRRRPYLIGLILLLALCLLPIATWPVALSGMTVHLRIAVWCLLGLNAIAAILCGSGRVGRGSA